MDFNQLYQSHNKGGLSRIDMLLSILDAAVEHLDAAARQTAEANAVQAGHHRMKAITMVNLLRSGLDPSHGELPIRLEQLYEFVNHSLVSGQLTGIESSAKVLQEIREGFQGIRDEAVRLEESGEIPSLPTQATVDTTC